MRFGNAMAGNIALLRLGLVFAAVLSPLIALAQTPAGAVARTTATEPLAEVNGETITAAEQERALGAKLSWLQEQIYDLKRQELESLIAQRLRTHESAKRGVSIAALRDAEVTSKVGS